MNTKKLIIFDIDGTLTETVYMDSAMYASAFSDFLGVMKINDNWDDYRYSTDAGFAIEIFEQHMGRAPQENEIKTIKEKFFALLEEFIEKDHSRCRPLLGAQTIFERITALKDWDIAIATGCWRESARIKLNYAGLPYHQIPLANSDDHIERHQIIQVAIDRAKAYYQQNAYSDIVYVGDRLWDYKASQQLGIRFIGVGSEWADGKVTEVPFVPHYRSDDLIDHLQKTAIPLVPQDARF